MHAVSLGAFISVHSFYCKCIDVFFLHKNKEHVFSACHHSYYNTIIILLYIYIFICLILFCFNIIVIKLLYIIVYYYADMYINNIHTHA